MISDSAAPVGPKKSIKIGRWLLWIISLFLVAVFLLAIINLAHPGDIEKALNEKQGSLTQVDPDEIIGDARHSFGASQPKIIIVEFGDFACPICKASYPKMRKVIMNHKDDIKLVYRHFVHPVYPDYKNRLQLALASECAQEQGKFWEMHDRLFDRQEYLMQDDLEKKDRILALAEELKLNVPMFGDCLDQRKYFDKIKTDFYTGEKNNIQGTPTWFVNGYEMTGDIPEDLLEEFFSQIINNKK